MGWGRQPTRNWSISFFFGMGGGGDRESGVFPSVQYHCLLSEQQSDEEYGS